MVVPPHAEQALLTKWDSPQKEAKLQLHFSQDPFATMILVCHDFSSYLRMCCQGSSGVWVCVFKAHMSEPSC